MKKKYVVPLTVIVLFSLNQLKAQQTTDGLINLLIQNQVIKQEAADSLRSEFAIEAQKNLKNEVFTVDLEIRPRTEYRYGFRQLRADSSRPAFFTSQRTRLTTNFKKERFGAVLSLQDIRTWGAADPRYTGASVQVFEAYAEPYFTSDLSLRMGKQRIMYDNQRLFAQNDWRNNAGTHDAFNLRYYRDYFETELVFAFNQSSEPLYFTPYTPAGFSLYKMLGVHYLKYRSKGGNWALTTINYFEGFQIAGVKNTEKQSLRYTDGGRIEYFTTNKSWYLTFSGYIQHGKNQFGKQLAAYYYQPEIKYTGKTTEVRLGMEYKSGNDLLSKEGAYLEVDHAFQYPHGVAHRFNGTMEYFASSFPGSAKDAGLFNPYLFIEQKIADKVTLSLQNHLFYTQHHFLNKEKNPEDRYVGYESDFLLIYRLNNYTKIDFGFSFLLAQKPLEYLAGGNSLHVPHWAYIQFTFTPKLLSVKK